MLESEIEGYFLRMQKLESEIMFLKETVKQNEEVKNQSQDLALKDAN